MSGRGLAIPPELLGSVERYAVYRCYSDAGELLYVGESGNLGKRLAAHAQKAWFLQVRGITLEWHVDELDAMKAERRAIHVEHPKYNVVHRNTETLAPLKPRVSRTAKPSRGRSRSRTPGRSWEETREIVLKLLQEEPDITGSEVGRRLGTAPSFGRRVMRRVITEQGGAA